MCRVCAGFPANSVLTLRMRLGSSVSTDGRFGFAAHRAAEFVGGRPTASSFLACPRKEPKKGTRGLGGLPGHRCAPRLRRAPQSGDAHSKRATGPLWIPRRESPCDPARRAGILRGCLRRMPGARYARRPISGLRAAFGGWPPKRGLRTAVAGAPPRGPGLSPLRGPGPADRILYQDGLRPNPCDPRAASGWPAAKVDGALSRISGRAYSIPPAAAPRAQCLCPGVSGTVPGVRFGEARPLLRGAQRPQGGGKLRGFAAHARKARERPVRALFSAAGLGQPSGLGRWVRPQPELSPQLVYPWGAAVTCGLWQGTPGGFSRGLAEVPLSALLPPTSWAPKKSARPPGRVPAFPPPQAAHLKRPGGARKKPRRAQRGKKIKAPPSRAYAETTCPFRSAVRFSKARGAFHRCS